MKRKLLAMLVCGIFAAAEAGAQVRYLEPTFTDAQIKITRNVMYGRNYTVLLGGPPFKLDSLYMDVYEPDPSVDIVTERPLIVYVHTGSFLPRYVNQLPTGARDDSATVEMCKRFAKKGYVVASISYRLGWLPTAPTEDQRKASIINAAYKGVQDLSNAIRYFKNDRNSTNAYKIDSNRICVGGQGTGGYITMAYASLDRQSEIKIAKFTDFSGTVPKAMVNDTIWGDRMGLGGAPGINMVNLPANTSDAHVAFNIGGAMGDTSWLEAGEMPLICIHPITDPFAPYKTGIVKVPGTNQNVVQVSGGYDIMAKENLLGNNAIYKGKVSDVYTTQANRLNNGNEGLFPIAGLANSSAPWEWWDTARIKLILTASGKFTPTQIATIIANGKASNPLMSKARAMLYIDTMQGYLAPRIAVSLGLVNSAGIIEKDLARNFSIYPNPARGSFTVTNNWKDIQMKRVTLMDISGKSLLTREADGISLGFSTSALKPGLYLVKIETSKGDLTQKLVVE